MKRKTHKTPEQNEDSSKAEWFALMGFRKDDHDKTGLLAFNDKHRPMYKIVHDISSAVKLPSKNVNSLSSYASPEKWLEFFSSEPELRNWKFHLVKVLDKSLSAAT